MPAKQTSGVAMPTTFIDAPPDHILVMQEIDKLLAGRENDFAGSIALTIFINVLMNQAGRDVQYADAMAKSFCKHAMGAYRAILAGEHKRKAMH
jgi:hypothetical protein